MNPPEHPCDPFQQQISAALDDGTTLPESVRDHLAHCPACAAFAELWTGPAAETLARPLPPAGVELRRRILALPNAARVAPAGPIRAHRSRSGFFQAVAAVVVIGLLGYWLNHLRPDPLPARSAEHRVARLSKAEIAVELAALDRDVKQGLAEVRAPLRTLNRILNR